MSRYLVGGNIVRGVPRLPNEYQEIEYLQTSGTQYINTTIIPKGDWSIEYVYARLASSTATGCLWCARGSTTSTNTFTTFLLNGTESRFDYANNIPETRYVVSDILKHTVYRNKNKVYIDEILKQTDTFSTFTAGGPLKFFASYTNGINNNIDNNLENKSE